MSSKRLRVRGLLHKTGLRHTHKPRPVTVLPVAASRSDSLSSMRFGAAASAGAVEGPASDL